jgi:hypothetical protein
MSQESMQNAVSKITSVWSLVDELLSSYNSNANLQFPTLMQMLAVKMNLEEKQVRELDPMVRFYVRNHPDWKVTRGAHGGIMRASESQKKEEERSAKLLVKNQLKAAIDAKIAQATPIVINSLSLSNPPSDPTSMLFSPDSDDDFDLDGDLDNDLDNELETEDTI